MLERVTGWSMRHPWKVIAGWLLLVAAVVVVGSSVSVVKVADADYRMGDSGHADGLVAAAGAVDHHMELVHLTPRSRSAADVQQAKAAATELATAWRAEPQVQTVEPVQISPKDGSLLIRADLKTLVTNTDVDVASMSADVQRIKAENPRVTVGTFGSVSTNTAINDQVSHDLQRSEKSSLPFTLVVMVAVFGSLIAAGLPVLVALMSVAAAGGLSGILSHVFPQESSVMTMIVLIGMAVGIDYCLFYLKREREERAKGAGTVDAVRIAAQTSGHAIVTSGLAVTVSLAGLLIMDFAAFNSLALGAVSVVLVAVAASLTLLPALLAKLGHKVDRLRIPGLGGRLAKVERARRRGLPVPPARRPLVQRMVEPIVHHPLAALVIGGIITAVLALPALGLRTMPGSVDSLPPNNPTVVSYNGIQRAFPTQGNAAQVVTTYTGSTQQAQSQLTAVAREAQRSGWVVAQSPRFNHGVAQLDLATSAPVGSDALQKDVAQLRTIVDRTVTADHGVTGDAARSVDMSKHLGDRMPWAIAAVLGLTSLMMAFAFRSILIGLLTTVLNLASVGVAFGVLAAVFQSDTGARALNFVNTGAVRDWVPMFLFSVLVGLSMDYHVFVMSRIKENIDRGLPVRAAIADGVGRTGGVVTSAAIVMVGVFSIFATLGLAEMKQIGLGLAVAIAVDATLIRLVLLPALLSLGGRRMWGRTRRVGTSASTRPLQAVPVGSGR
ncbi:MMPL family transporter [Calidifontibacter terrae]